MPFILIVAGVVLLIAAVRNTQQDLFLLLAKDFTGKNNFIYWVLAILIIGAVGYIPRLKPVSDGFLILVILTLFIRKGGFFDAFTQQIADTQTTSPKVSATGGGTQAAFIDLGGGIQVGLPHVSFGGGGVTIGV